jgi:hypothetical protein
MPSAKLFLNLLPSFGLDFALVKTKLSLLNRKQQTRSFELSNAFTTAIHGVSGKTR